MAASPDSFDPVITTAEDSLRDDPRQSHDDPLLDSLMIVCKLHNIITSRNVLTAGLPLQANLLTQSVFPRAAQRAGLKARVLHRPLDKISAMSLPAILLLKNEQAAVLIGWDEQHRARLLPTETEGGEVVLDMENWLKPTVGK